VERLRNQPLFFFENIRKKASINFFKELILMKINYRFHNPNPPDKTIDKLLKIFIDVNMPKVEKAIKTAIETENIYQNIGQIKKDDDP
jgi:hypothetical protein